MKWVIDKDANKDSRLEDKDKEMKLVLKYS